VDEGPGRCRHARPERPRIVFVDAGEIEGLGHLRGQERQRRARAVDDRDRKGPGDLLPVLPAMEVFRLSAPMIQMKWTCGLRALTRSSVRRCSSARALSRSRDLDRGSLRELLAERDPLGQRRQMAAAPSADCPVSPSTRAGRGRAAMAISATSRGLHAAD
jgi:hypothetical protein